MKTVRPLWGRGQMVSPQHFQQEAAQAAWHTECVARLGAIHPWGVARTAFDAALLKQGKLKADHLCACVSLTERSLIAITPMRCRP